MEKSFQNHKSRETILGVAKPCQVKVTQQFVFRKQNISASKANESFWYPSFACVLSVPDLQWLIQSQCGIGTIIPMKLQRQRVHP